MDDGRIRPLAETTFAGFDSFGRPGSMSVPGRGTTTFTHSAEGLATATLPTGHTTTMTYQNHKLTTIGAAGLTSTFDINDLGETRSTTDTRGKTTTFSHDGMGRVKAVTTPHAQTTRLERTSGGRTSAVVRPDGKRIVFSYDPSGRVSSTTDEANRSYGQTYDAYGRVISVSDPLGTTRFEYDLMSNLTAIVDPLQRRTTFDYDNAGRLESTTDPAGASETYEYYPSGRLREYTDRRAIQRNFAYDPLGRLASVNFSDSTPSLSATYNDLARTITVANGTDTLTRSYDQAGRLLSEASTLIGSTVSYTYNDNHQRETLRLNGALVSGYGYEDGYLSSVTFDSHELGFTYDDLGRRRTLSFPNGLETTYDYDPLNGWLTHMTTAAGNTTAWDTSYTHDVVGNRLSRAMAGETEAYQYDAGSRLTAADRSGTVPRSWSWDFDLVGNRTQERTDGNPRSMVHDVRNRLLSAQAGGLVRVEGQTTEAATVSVDGHAARMLPGNAFEADVPRAPGQTTFVVEARDSSGNLRTSTYQINMATDDAGYAYDANGNLSSRTDATGVWTYEWNGVNQLTRVVKDATEIARFEYDPMGRRVRKIAGGVTSSFTYDGADILRETRSGGTSFTYIHGPGFDEPLASKTGSGDITYIHADGLGSIVRATNQSGSVVSTRQYDAWGNLEIGASQPGYAFTGREWDPETGLYYYRARYYEPKTGRFISEDPIRFDGGINFYGYVTNSPPNWRDPFGLKAGDKFSTPDKAVMDVFQGFVDGRPETISKWEYGGRVCKSTGGYFCTTPRTDKKSGSVDVGSCPAGTKQAGRYHTHIREDDSASMDFNPFDEANANREGIPSYLLNPDLDVLKYVPPGPDSLVIGSVKPAR